MIEPLLLPALTSSFPLFLPQPPVPFYIYYFTGQPKARGYMCVAVYERNKELKIFKIQINE